ncbi:hypothetical protein AZE12_00395 [Escherichia coli]|nr:hypothetical protein [Escherichia coli]EEV7401592.1 hypothetical protein [Escherichia coli]EFO0348357.1 hypothetical protein [Escherichia coli]MHO30208.1 hypothetical protein [Escherichia coli]MHY38044.1 hypothetical protein [Escherichia coli]
MTLVITDGEFWWSWRELNQRPFVFNLLIFIVLFYFSHASCTSRILFKEIYIYGFLLKKYSKLWLPSTYLISPRVR